MNEEQAWQNFEQTGSVQAYLEYVRLTRSRQGADRPVQEEPHADPYRGFGPQGEYRG